MQQCSNAAILPVDLALSCTLDDDLKSLQCLGSTMTCNHLPWNRSEKEISQFYNGQWGILLLPWLKWTYTSLAKLRLICAWGQYSQKYDKCPFPCFWWCTITAAIKQQCFLSCFLQYALRLKSAAGTVTSLSPCLQKGFWLAALLSV